jgi:Amt family ammonium transporter
MVMLGALRDAQWVGWFGFNGGSDWHTMDLGCKRHDYTYPACRVLGLGLVGTHPLWQIIARLVTGTIAGLASITPHHSWLIEALLISAIAGIMCRELCHVVKRALKIDDTLDVFAVHGVGGMFEYHCWRCLVAGLDGTVRRPCGCRPLDGDCATAIACRQGAIFRSE